MKSALKVVIFKQQSVFEFPPIILQYYSAFFSKLMCIAR